LGAFATTPGSPRKSLDGLDWWKVAKAIGWSALSVGLTAATDKISEQLAGLDLGEWKALILVGWAAVAQVIYRYVSERPPQTDALEWPKT